MAKGEELLVVEDVKKHFPVTQGIVIFTTLSIIFFNLIVDLLYAVIDPRIRLA